MKFSGKSITIKIPLTPHGKMAPRRGKIITTNSGKQFATTHKAKKQTNRENDIRFYVDQAKPESPWSGPVAVYMTCYMPIPASWPKWKYDISDIMPTMKPDLDNMAKMIGDVMSGLIYQDDRQICFKILKKFFGPNPCWMVKVEEIEGLYRHDVKKTELMSR